MKDSTISKLIEPLMHGYALSYGFSISISLIAVDAFNPLKMENNYIPIILRVTHLHIQYSSHTIIYFIFIKR